MTKCVVAKSNGLIMAVEVKGHALAGTFGRDIVCNSISMIAQNLAVGIVNVAKLENAEVNADANAILEIKLSNEDAFAVKLLTDTFLEMITLLSSQYPNYLTLEVNDEKN